MVQLSSRISGIIAAPLAAILLSCQPQAAPGTDPTPTPEPDPDPQPQEDTVVVRERTLAAPTDLALSCENDSVLLCWTDNSYKEEGYEVLRLKDGESTAAQSLIKANSTSWGEPEPASGTYTYTVRSYYHTDRSEGASVVFENKIMPVVKIGSVQKSHWAISALVELADDGGEQCEVGMAVYDGTEQISGFESAASKVKSGDSHYALAEWLQPGHSYKICAWATNSSGTAWSESQAVVTTQAPSALNPNWTEKSVDYNLPSTVHLYKTVTSVTGHSVNIWYAEFNSSGAEFRTTLAGSLTTPTEYVCGTLSGKSLITVNGGYFGSPNTSYSQVIDRGSKKAYNISALTRTNNYELTRGVFGVTADGTPSVHWCYDGTRDTWYYDTPLPVIDGEAVRRASATYPATAIDWTPYSAIGGAPVLIKDGVICFDFSKTAAGKYITNHELLQADIFASGLRAPRTALGCRADGSIVLLVCDGRLSGGSAGLTLDELARIMLGLGCTDALNLDGGGSSQMVAGSSGTLLNNPSDGTERRVLSFVTIAPRL